MGRQTGLANAEPVVIPKWLNVSAVARPAALITSAAAVRWQQLALRSCGSLLDYSSVGFAEFSARETVATPTPKCSARARTEPPCSA